MGKMSKFVLLVAAIVTVLALSSVAFAQTEIRGYGNIFNLHRYSSYAVGDTKSEYPDRLCTVTVIAYNGNTGASNTAYANSYAQTNVHAPNEHCTRATSSHYITYNGTTYYSVNLDE